LAAIAGICTGGMAGVAELDRTCVPVTTGIARCRKVTVIVDHKRRRTARNRIAIAIHAGVAGATTGSRGGAGAGVVGYLEFCAAPVEHRKEQRTRGIGNEYRRIDKGQRRRVEKGEAPGGLGRAIARKVVQRVGRYLGEALRVRAVSPRVQIGVLEFREIEPLVKMVTKIEGRTGSELNLVVVGLDDASVAIEDGKWSLEQGYPQHVVQRLPQCVEDAKCLGDRQSGGVVVNTLALAIYPDQTVKQRDRSLHEGGPQLALVEDSGYGPDAAVDGSCTGTSAFPPGQMFSISS
jgi:hypothetical protein